MTQNAGSPHGHEPRFERLEDIEAVRRFLQHRSADHVRGAFDRLLQDFDGMAQNRDDWRRHAQRLHRRLAQGTDRDSLLGDLKKAQVRVEALKRRTAAHLDGRCRARLRKVNQKLDILVEAMGRDRAIPLIDPIDHLPVSDSQIQTDTVQERNSHG